MRDKPQNCTYYAKKERERESDLENWICHDKVKKISKNRFHVRK
jgi:hypothetical protein